MDSFWITIIVWGIVIIGIETGMWYIFHRKAVGIYFPAETGSAMRFFTTTRLRLFAFLHTVLLAVIVFFAYFYIW